MPHVHDLRHLLHMLPGRAVVAAGAGGPRSAPDALTMFKYTFFGSAYLAPRQDISEGAMERFVSAVYNFLDDIIAELAR